MFGVNLKASQLLAPAEKVIDGSTSDAGCASYHLTEAGASFTATVKVGDLVVKDPTGTPVSAYVLEVVSDTDLILDKDLQFDSSVYDIIRPSMAILRPGREIEWTLHTISFPKGDEIYRVGVWFGDGERESLLEDYVTFWRRQGVSESDLPSMPPGFRMHNQNIKADYNEWVILKSFVLEACFVTVQGINKTMSAA